MADILTTITEQRLKDVAAAKESFPMEKLEQMIASAPPVVDFRARLRRCGRMAVMAEVSDP